MFLNFLLLISMLVLGAFQGSTTSSANGDANGYVPLDYTVRDIYSREILFQAQPKLRFAQFAKVRRDFQAVQGKQVVFTKYNNLSGGGAIEEDVDIETDNMGTAEVTVPVKEYAKAVSVSELLLQTSFQDVMGNASRLLANHCAVTVDTMLRDSLLATPNKIYGNGRLANAAAFNGAATEDKIFSTQTVKSAVQFLEENNAPRYDNEYYVCFLTPAQATQMRNDPDWIRANTYNGRRQIYLGEIGMYDSVIFISTTQMPTYANAAAAVAAGWTGVTLDDTKVALIFGENAVAWGIALDVELRDDGIINFGRKHSLAWYAIWGSKILETDNVYAVITV